MLLPVLQELRTLWGAHGASKEQSRSCCSGRRCWGGVCRVSRPFGDVSPWLQIRKAFPRARSILQGQHLSHVDVSMLRGGGGSPRASSWALSLHCTLSLKLSKHVGEMQGILGFWETMPKMLLELLETFLWIYFHKSFERQAFLGAAWAHPSLPEHLHFLSSRSPGFCTHIHVKLGTAHTDVWQMWAWKSRSTTPSSDC